MKLKIKSSEEFERLLRALGNELVQASIYFKLRKDLVGEIGEYEAELNLSATFWSLVLDSLLDSTLISLCRIYDSHKYANSLPNVLDTIKENVIFFKDGQNVGPDISLLTKLDTVPNLDQLDKDIESVSKNNPLIKNLRVWRNNLLAHKDSNKIANRKDISEDYPFTLEDIANLLENGLILVNRYCELFLNVYYTEDIIRHDDYKVILHSLRQGFR